MPVPLFVGNRGGDECGRVGMIDVVHTDKGRSSVIDQKASRSNTKGHTSINQNKGSRLVKHKMSYGK